MTQRQFTWAASAALVVLGFLAYANTFSGDWVWDDVSSVLLHENVQNPAKLGQLFREDQHAFGRGEGNFYRPLVSVSFMVDFLLSYDPTLDTAAIKGYPDVKPLLFHLSNTLWHCAASVLLFLLLGRLGAPRMVQAAASVLFVLHPMHTEAVAYISGRADMMSATFILAALLCAITDTGSPRRWFGLMACVVLLLLGLLLKTVFELSFSFRICWALMIVLVATTDATNFRQWWSTTLAAIFLILGLCSKESSTIFPILLLLVLLFRQVSSSQKPKKWLADLRSVSLGATVITVASYIDLRSDILDFTKSSADGNAGHGFLAYLATLPRLGMETCQAFAFYIKTLFLPTNLHMEQTLAGVPGWTAGLGLLFLLACIGAAYWGYRSGNRRITLALVWFLAAWLPISGIFPLNAPMAEHWMYVPMAGFWWAVMELLVLASQRLNLRLAPVALAAVLGLLFLNQTIVRNSDWRDNETIFRATLAENPDTLRVHSNLAVTYDFLQGNYPGAVRHYKAAIALYEKQKDRPEVLLPEEIPLRLSLAEMLLRQRNYSDALPWFGALMPLTQQDNTKADGAKAAFGLGQCYLGLGNYPQAAELMQQAVALDPSLAGPYNDLMRGAPLPGPR